MSDEVITRAEEKYLKWLSRKKRPYFFVREWKHGVRHCHIAIIVPGKIYPHDVRLAWANALRKTGATIDFHSEPMKSAEATARYLMKDLKRFADGRERHEGPPPAFQGRLMSYSRDFFSQPTKVLWAQVRAEWFKPGRRDRAEPSRGPATPTHPRE